MTNKHIRKVIGWAVINNQLVAHHWSETHTGINAMSLCWLREYPRNLRPATDQQHCPMCEILLDEPTEQEATITADDILNVTE